MVENQTTGILGTIIMLREPIKIEFFGHFRVRHNKRAITRFRTQKTGVLLAYLAFYNQSSHPREKLIEMLWNECEPALGRNSLSQALSSLRRQLEPPGVASGEVLQADRYNVRLNPETYQTDAADFEKACQGFQRAKRETERAAAFASTTGLYRGEFLPGFYEDWNLLERDRFQNLFLQVLIKRAGQLEKMGELDSAIENARRAVDIDSFNEESHLYLMHLYAADNKPARALKQFRKLSKIFEEELGIPPSKETAEFARELETGAVRSAKSIPAPEISKADKKTASPESVLPSGVTAILAVETREAEADGVLGKFIHRHRGNEIEAGANLIAAFFGSVGDAFNCALEIQLEFDQKSSPDRTAPAPQMALDLGEIGSEKKSAVRKRLRSLLDQTLNLLKTGNPGQFLCSETAAVLLLKDSESNANLRHLGNYRLTGKDKAERIFQADQAGRSRRDFPALKAGPEYENTLPFELSRFFGRENEIAKLRQWLGPENPDFRLATVTGPGGTGKTRLSLKVAEELRNAYRNAIWFVSLASIKRPDYVPPAILEAMRQETPPSFDPLDYLISVLSGEKTLLVLDNFEQLLPESAPARVERSTAIVRTLLERIPGLKCLITSRKRLNLFGENEFFLEPLPVPLEHDTVEQINLCESVRMFADRAQTVRPTFQITSHNADVVAELCRRLEGIPLALELAAAQIQIQTPSKILGSLLRRLDFLTDRRRQAETRHRQMRATIDWSYRLLPSDVRIFFAGLSVFQDGGNLTDVEAVCDDPLALDHLALLQDSSFLRVEENNLAEDMRFRLLETLREYGEEKLDAGQRESLSEKHARNYLGLAERSEPLLKGKDQSVWLRRLEQDHQNLLSALDWSLKTENVEIGLRLVCALRRFWEIRGHVNLGREKLNRLWELNENRAVSEDVRAAALLAAGKLALAASDYLSGRGFLDKCRKIYQKKGDVDGEANALGALGRTAFYLGEYKEAVSICQNGLRLFRQLKDDHGAAVSLTTLGMIAGEQNDFPNASRYFRESLESFRRLGNRRGVANQLNNLGVIFRRQGAYDQSRKAFSEALEIRRELRDRRYVAGSLNNLSLLAENEGNYDEARRLQEEGLAIWREIGDDYGTALALEILGIINRRLGNDARSESLFEESLTIYRRLENKLGIAETLCSLGDLLSSKNEFETAQKHLGESFKLMSEMDNKLGLAEVLEACSRLALMKERHKISTELLFAAGNLRRKVGGSSTIPEQKNRENQIAQLQAALSQKDFQKAKDRADSISIRQLTTLISNI
ncbi:MAG: tetratricopeptide repeat protein [Pyrinomonadaceae bacterium]